MSEAQVDGERLASRIAAFAKIGAFGTTGVDRPAFSALDREARRLIASIAIERGLGVFQDAATNLFIARPGSADAPPLLIGSHLDSQPTGGRYDGALGTLAALEVMETLEDRGIATPIPVELVVWANEEGSRFAPGTMGSHAFAGGNLPDPRQRDAHGIALGDEIAATLAALPEAAERPLGFPIAGYIELHIEQGPILEAAHVPIGAVGGIQGTRWLGVAMHGETGHAGTTPLGARRDAAVALVEGLARLNRSIMPADPAARFTAGRLSSEPDSINAVAALARCTLDIRHPEAGRLDAIEAEARAALADAASAHGCRVEFTTLFSTPPTRFDPRLVAAVEAAAARLSRTSLPMVSGAFHDALPIAAIAPSAMIFVPCRGGISHNEREYVAPDDCVAGTAVLLETVLEATSILAGENRPSSRS